MGHVYRQEVGSETESPYTDIVLDIIGEFMRGFLQGFGGDLDMNVQLIASRIHPRDQNDPESQNALTCSQSQDSPTTTSVASTTVVKNNYRP